MTTPTKKTYDGLNHAYAFFNDRLFGGRLPPCLITMQRSKKAYGYFAGGRFGTRDGREITDEIALNPSHFSSRTTEQSLSTLVHEMTHLEQHHFGTPSRNGYHNREWAGLMRAVSLRSLPTAILSRQVGVIRGQALILNLPGQPKAIKETLEGAKDADGKSLVPGIFAAVPYCIDLIGGPYIETHEAVIKAFRPKSAIRPKA